MAGLKVKVRDTNGNCCCGLGACVLFCSTRGGIASLCGYPEFTSPSVPPKKYRRKTLSGGSSSNVYANSSDCSIQSGTDTVSGSGSCEFDKDTCAFTMGGQVTSDGTSVPACSVTEDAKCTFNLSQTQTTRENSATNVCCNPDSPTIFRIQTADSRKDTLTIEDTDLDAIKRIPGINVWGAYSSCFLSPQCCRTAWAIRGAGQFTFEYLESQLLARVSNLPHNVGITVKVDLYRRPYGTGTYALYQTIENDGASNDVGFVEIDLGVVNNTQGFETYAANCRASLTNP